MGISLWIARNFLSTRFLTFQLIAKISLSLFSICFYPMSTIQFPHVFSSLIFSPSLHLCLPFSYRLCSQNILSISLFDGWRWKMSLSKDTCKSGDVWYFERNRSHEKPRTELSALLVSNHDCSPKRTCAQFPFPFISPPPCTFEHTQTGVVIVVDTWDLSQQSRF